MVDVWIETGQRKEVQFTWDMTRNDNLLFEGKFKPRCRFDRVYLRQSMPPTVEAINFGLIGLKRLKPHVCFPRYHITQTFIHIFQFDSIFLFWFSAIIGVFVVFFVLFNLINAYNNNYYWRLKTFLTNGESHQCFDLINWLIFNIQMPYNLSDSTLYDIYIIFSNQIKLLKNCLKDVKL